MSAPTRTDAVKAAKADAKMKGCTCDVIVTPRRIASNLWDIAVRHDDWCPVLSEGDQHSVVVVKTGEQ